MKKLINILFLSCILCANNLGAQVIFQKTYGGIQAEHNECFNRSTGVINITNDKGFVLCHSTLSYGSGPFSQGIYFLKLDKNGDTVFTRTFYNSADHCFGRSVYQTADGGYILGAAFGTIGAGLIKTDGNGNILWSRQVGTYHCGYYGLLLKDNNFLCTGRSILAKVNTSGALMFGKRYSTGNSNTLTFYSSEQCANGDIVSVGFMYSYHNDILVMKTDANGNVKFAKTYGRSDKDEQAYKAIELSDKSIAVIGWNEPSSGGDYNISLLRVDSIGNPLVFKTIGDSYYQWSNSIIKDSIDNLYFTGVTTYSNSTQPNQGSAFLIKADSSGNMLDMRRYDNVEYGNGLVFTASGELALCGMTAKSGAGGEDLFVVKSNSLGTAGCNIKVHSLPVNNVTPYLTSSLNLVVTNDVTLTNYTLSARPGALVATLCYSCSPPNVNIVAPKNEICAGEKLKLTGTGASSYSWTVGSSASTLQVSPLTTTTYTLTGYLGPQCNATSTFTVKVNKCTSLDELKDITSIKVFPIPSNGKVTISCTNNIDQLEVINCNGSVILFSKPGNNETEIELSTPGVYYLRINSNGDLLSSKIVLE